MLDLKGNTCRRDCIYVPSRSCTKWFLSTRLETRPFSSFSLPTQFHRSPSRTRTLTALTSCDADLQLGHGRSIQTGNGAAAATQQSDDRSRIGCHCPLGSHTELTVPLTLVCTDHAQHTRGQPTARASTRTHPHPLSPQAVRLTCFARPATV